MISQTGMVMVDVSMLSGFAIATETTTTSLIRKVEASPGKVSLYLDSVSILAVCHCSMACAVGELEAGKSFHFTRIAGRPSSLCLQHRRQQFQDHISKTVGDVTV